MIDRLLKSLVGAAALSAFAALPLTGQQQEKSPYEKPDDSWISIEGTVQDVTRDQFTLSYGNGIITVEMDDGDRDADAYKLMRGDSVAVTGVIDDDFLERASIEASSVYVKNLGTTFYSSAVDEEDVTVTFVAPLEVSRTVIQGTVREVNDDEFALDTGTRTITVEVDELGYDPLDEEGYQKIEVGDRVSVRGEMGTDLFEGRVFEAEWVMTLKNGNRSTGNGS